MTEEESGRIGGGADNGYGEYYISEDWCIGCGNCREACPVNCIFRDGHIYRIDGFKCVECGGCASICPTRTIRRRE